MKTAIRILIILLCVLLAAAGVVWYMLGHGGRQAGTDVPSVDIAPARQLLSDLKSNSKLRFSLAVPRNFDWYVASSQGNPTQMTLSGVAMVAKSATSDDATQIDAWLRQQGFNGDAENNSFGDTTVCEGYVKDSVAVIVVTPVTASGASAQSVTELVVYAGILPGTATGN